MADPIPTDPALLAVEQEAADAQKSLADSASANVPVELRNAVAQEGQASALGTMATAQSDLAKSQEVLAAALAADQRDARRRELVMLCDICARSVSGLLAHSLVQAAVAVQAEIDKVYPPAT